MAPKKFVPNFANLTIKEYQQLHELLKIKELNSRQSKEKIAETIIKYLLENGYEMKELAESFNFTDLKDAIEIEIKKKQKQSNIKIEKIKHSQYHNLLNQLRQLFQNIEKLDEESDKNKQTKPIFTFILIQNNTKEDIANFWDDKGLS